MNTSTKVKILLLYAVSDQACQKIRLEIYHKVQEQIWLEIQQPSRDQIVEQARDKITRQNLG